MPGEGACLQNVPQYMDRRRGEPHDEAGFVQGEQWLAVIRSGVDQADAGAQHRHAGDDHERTEQAQHGMRRSVPHVRFGTGVVARKPVAGACALQQDGTDEQHAEVDVP